MATNANVNVVNGNLEEALLKLRDKSKSSLKRFYRKGGRGRFISNTERRHRAEAQALRHRNEESLHPVSEYGLLAHQAWRASHHPEPKIPAILPPNTDLQKATSHHVISIIEFQSQEPQFGVIKDIGRDLYRFPSGGREAVDDGILGATRRESSEEIFYELGVVITFGPQAIIGTISKRDHQRRRGLHYKTAVFSTVPGDTPVKKGKEQSWASRKNRAWILEQIANGQFQGDHAALYMQFDMMRFPDLQTPARS